MDIYEYLKKDHRKVAELFKLFEKTNDGEYQMEIFANIYKELFLHANAEQETFYKLLENFDESRADTKHAEKEHAEIESLLEEISKIKSPNATFKQKVMHLKKIVDHHVSEEEGPLFRKAKKVIDKDEAWIIKEKMHDMKDKLMQNLEQENRKEEMEI